MSRNRRTWAGLYWAGLAVAALLCTGTITHAVTTILGASVNQPSDVIPLCGAPQICPDFWDLRPSEGTGVVYGNRAFSFDNSCLKSIDGAKTFTLCPTNYAVTNVGREVDVPGDGSILSLRFEAGSFAGCRLDRSTDAGNSWSVITVAAGANLQCVSMDTQFPGEHLRCQGAICLTYVRNTSTGRIDIYRSTDNGVVWAIVSTGNVPVNCSLAQHMFFDGTVGIATCQRTITAATESTRVSIDGGATWNYIIPPSNLDYCGRASILPGFDTGYAQICYTTNPGTLGTQFRLMSSNAVAATPTTQPNLDLLGFSPFVNPNAIGLNSTNIWMFNGYTTPTCCAAGRVMKLYNAGDVIAEIPDSLNRFYAPARLYQGRPFQGGLLVTAPYQNIHFALLRGS